jgi:sugar/nucleoside kinase (ribokinase family)
VERKIDVVIAGHVCLDIIPGFPKGRRYGPADVFTPGKLVEVTDAAVATGGPVSNTGIGLAKLGMNVSFIAKIGADRFGSMTVDLLKEWAGIEGLKRTDEESSSYTVAIAPPGIDRIFFHAPGTNNTFSARDIDYGLCAQARLFHLGYPPLMRALYSNDGEQLVDVFRRVKEVGTTTSLDMALPDPQSDSGKQNWARILERLLPFVDIFHPSAEEALFMAQPEKWKRLRDEAGTGEILDLLQGADYTELSDIMLGWGCAMVSHKSGHRGFYLRTGGGPRLEQMGSAAPADPGKWAEREIWAPAYHVEHIASATGSGDSSLAGFTTAYLHGDAPERCVAAANALGYQNLQALDAISGIKDWAETLKITADMSMARNEIVTGDGWRFDGERKLAFGPKDAVI